MPIFSNSCRHCASLLEPLTISVLPACLPVRSRVIGGPAVLMRQRVPVQCIKRFIMHSKKTAFIVEHDFIMAAYLADRVILYEGKPSEEVRL